VTTGVSADLRMRPEAPRFHEKVGEMKDDKMKDDKAMEKKP